MKLIKSSPAVGWVRADKLADEDATREILQLRRRVDELQTELSQARIFAPKGSEDLAQGEEKCTVNFSFIAKLVETREHKNYQTGFTPTWNKIFACIAPLMIHEANEAALKEALDYLSWQENYDQLQKRKDLAGGRFYKFEIQPSDFQLIKVQLCALGLITKNDKARSFKDYGTYWTLTPYGGEVMTQLLAIRRNNVSAAASNEVVVVEET